MTTALVIAAHGSHYHPDTADPAWVCADVIRTLGLFDEVTAAFWKEQPTFSHVLAGLTADDVTVVPLFSSEGYFSQSVLPAELRPRRGQTVRQTAAVGASPALSSVVGQRVEKALRHTGWRAEETAVVVVGHGTSRHAESGDTTSHQAELLRQQGCWAAVHTAFLDEAPYVADLYNETSDLQFIVVPFFIAAGLHAQEDVPEALGITPTPYAIQHSHGRILAYTPPVGLTADLYRTVLAVAGVADVPELSLFDAESQGRKGRRGSFPLALSAPLRPCVEETILDVWAAFPRLRLGVLPRQQVGEVWLGRAGYLCHVADAGKAPAELRPLAEPLAVRRALRHTAEGAFRPWATLDSLPTGWVIHTPTIQIRSAALLAIYPHLAASPPPQTVAQVAARQQGKYRAVGELTAEIKAAITEATCGRCCLQPSWAGDGRGSPLGCAEPCVWWLNGAVLSN